MPGRGSEHG
ncbi:unnamed protein product, partial [Didymodactylos carnosus]